MRGGALGAALGGAIAACFSQPPAPGAPSDARGADGRDSGGSAIDAAQIGSCAATAIDRFLGPKPLGQCNGSGSATASGGEMTLTPKLGSAASTAALACQYNTVSFAHQLRIHVPTMVMQMMGVTEFQLMTNAGFSALWNAHYNPATSRYELLYNDENGVMASAPLDAAAMGWWMFQIESPQHMTGWYGSDGSSWTAFGSTTLASQGDLTQPGTVIFYVETEGGMSAVFDHFETCP